MKNKKILKQVYLFIFVFSAFIIRVNANTTKNELLIVQRPNEIKEGISFRYYKEYKNQNMAKQFILTEFENELRFLFSKINLKDIDIDNNFFQEYVMSELNFDNIVDNAKIKKLTLIMDIYENKEKNNKIDKLKEIIMSKTKMERIYDNDILDKLESIMPIDNSSILLQNTVFANYSNGYNPSDAITYAHRWAYDHNDTTYIYYSNSDCANFVSQCLFEGGMNAYYKDHWPLVGNIIRESTKNWYFYDEHGEKAPSHSWTTASGFYKHWTSRGAVATSNLNNFAVGDPIGCDWSGDGDINHIVIVDGKTGNTNTTITYSGHTSSKANEPIKTLFDYSTGTKLYALKVNNASN